MNDLEAIRAAYSAFEQKMPARPHQMGAMEMDAVRAAIDAYTARAAQSAPGAVSRAEVLEEAAKVCDAERDHLQQFHTTFKSHGGYITALNLACDIRKLKDSPPRAEAAPRGTPQMQQCAPEGLPRRCDGLIQRLRDMARAPSTHPAWSLTDALVTAASVLESFQRADPRAPEPSHLIDSLTELETEVKPRLSECMRVAREAVERAGFVYPANPREVAREAAKVVYELFTSEHLPTCGWFQWPDGRVGQDGECRCPEPRAPEPEAGDKSVETMCSLPSSLTEHVCGAMPASRKIKHYWRVECACGLETAKCSTEAMAVQVLATANPPRASEDGEVSADEVERLARELHEVDRATYTSIATDPLYAYDNAADGQKERYRRMARYALTHRSAAAKVPRVEECERAAIEAWERQGASNDTELVKLAARASRAIFARDESEVKS